MKLENFDRFIPRKSASKGKLASGLGAVNLLVYAGLTSKMGKKRVIQISYQELSEYLGLSKSGVQKAIYKLERAKLIKRLPPKFRTAVPTYIIL